MKALAYIRCSGIGQLDGDGPSRQRDAIQAFATGQGIEITQWFTESHTGTDLEGRPEFRKMRAELVSDGVRTVIVERLDRLARDVMIQETIIGDFKKHGIDLRSATAGEEDLCSNEPTRTLVRQILGAIAGYERAMIISKLNAGRARKRAQGQKAEGVYRYGTKAGEAETLAKIQSMRARGETPIAIARWMNSEGIPTRYGARWHAATITKILRRVSHETSL